MGKKVLVDISLIKELCESIKRNNNKITGKLKIKLDENESKTHSAKKINKVKRLCLSGKRKAEKRSASKQPKSRKISGEEVKQGQISESESTDTESSENGSYTDDDTDNFPNQSDSGDSGESDITNDQRTASS